MKVSVNNQTIEIEKDDGQRLLLNLEEAGKLARGLRQMFRPPIPGDPSSTRYPPLPTTNLKSFEVYPDAYRTNAVLVFFGEDNGWDGLVVSKDDAKIVRDNLSKVIGLLHSPGEPVTQ